MGHTSPQHQLLPHEVSCFYMTTEPIFEHTSEGCKWGLQSHRGGAFGAQPLDPERARFPYPTIATTDEMQTFRNTGRKTEKDLPRASIRHCCQLNDDKVLATQHLYEIWPGSTGVAHTLRCSLGCTSVCNKADGECLQNVLGHSRLLRLADRKLSGEILRAQRNLQTPYLMAWLLVLLGHRGLDSFWMICLYSAICYLIAKYTYRALLCPLAKFPGPRIASLTKLYEAYHVLVKNDWLENLKSLHEQYGPIVRIGPNELHFIDHKFCLDYHKRPDLLKCDNYYGLLNKLLGGLASPMKHTQRAAAMRPIFSGKTLAQFMKTLDDYLEEFHSRLSDVSGGEVTNLTHYLWALTNDVMISYLVEENYGFLRVFDLGAAHDKTRAFSAIDLATILRCLPPVKVAFDVFPVLRSYSPLGWLDSLVRDHVRPIVKTWDDENSHQGALARIFNELGNETLTVHESSQAIFIGNESLLSNLTFLMHYIIQNPECVRKIRAELDTLDLGLYGHRVWRDPRVLQLRYLDAVCRESARLSSPGWHRQPRQSLEPVNYQGAIIPPMTSMSFTPTLLEHDPALFPEPDVFKPERWIGFSEESKATRNHAVTFGTGTRTCLGQHIAQKVLRKTVACLVYNFNVSLWDEELDRLQRYRYLDTYPKKGHEGYLKVRLTPRFGCHT